MHVARREKTDFLEKLAFEEAACFFNCLSQDVSPGDIRRRPRSVTALCFRSTNLWRLIAWSSMTPSFTLNMCETHTHTSKIKSEA